MTDRRVDMVHGLWFSNPCTKAWANRMVCTQREGSIRQQLKAWTGTSPVVQWLGLCVPSAGAQVPSLVGEIGPAGHS